MEQGLFLSRPTHKAGVLVLEKLNTQGMGRSAQGTVVSPGSNVHRKQG